jgi:hypothetical protein
MRSWILPTILGLTILLLVIALPIFWQWSYQARLLHAVPLGSTTTQYDAATLAGRLGPIKPWAGTPFWRPLNFDGVVYTIFAVPRWNSSGRLIGFSISAELAVRSHTWWPVPPDQNTVSAWE